MLGRCLELATAGLRGPALSRSFCTQLVHPTSHGHTFLKEAVLPTGHSPFLPRLQQEEARGGWCRRHLPVPQTPQVWCSSRRPSTAFPTMWRTRKEELLPRLRGQPLCGCEVVFWRGDKGLGAGRVLHLHPGGPSYCSLPVVPPSHALPLVPE